MNRSRPPRSLLFLSLAWILAACSTGALAAPVQTPEVEVELIAENNALVAGENWVALRVRPTPEWHVYWQNPGDSGIPTKLKWALPEGVRAGDIQWPYPHPESLGELTNYGYGAETLHLVPITVDASIAGPVTLQATASWLACRDVCIPGKAELLLSLPVAATTAANPDWAPSFAQARAELPVAVDWPAQFAVDDNSVSLQVSAALPDDAQLSFFPYANDLVNHTADQRVATDADSFRLSQSLSDYFIDAPAEVAGVLVVDAADGTKAYEVHASPGNVAAVPESALQASPVHADGSGVPAEAVPPTFVLILLFALLGGLVLNLMPCVFPVLSLKALSLVKSAGGDGRERRRQVYAYTVGVVASCVSVAVAMLALRSAGEAVGWGFQLQSPAFVGLLAYVMFALGLSLSGAVQLGLGLMGVGSGLAARPGLSGSFFTGVLAVVVASPCTAPFMGSAMGYAMTQPAYVALTVFATLGLGLALPFLLIGWFPRLAALLPKPGAWMESFKQFMAFPLYLTVVWLLWVLVRQTDAGMLARVMMGLVAISFALWLWNRSGPVSAVLKLGSLTLALALLFIQPSSSMGAGAHTGYTTEAWSTERVAELRAEGRTIFVDFTADWCLSCKVNERVALKSDRVSNAFIDGDVAVLVGDWTRSDPAITEELARFGRNGVPLYLVYVDGGEPKILPQLLTPDIVVKALD